MYKEFCRFAVPVSSAGCSFEKGNIVDGKISEEGAGASVHVINSAVAEGECYPKQLNVRSPPQVEQGHAVVDVTVLHPHGVVTIMNNFHHTTSSLRNQSISAR